MNLNHHAATFKRYVRSFPLALLASTAIAAAEPAVTLVADGRGAVIVTADNPLPVSVYAAAELVRHVALATGVTLPVVTESAVPEGSASRIFIGPTLAARAQGINVTNLWPETFVMRTVGRDLYIAGEEDKSDPFDYYSSKCGTLFGVYELLERAVKVRWLWPGELGTYVPQAERITLAATDETVTPRLAYREIIWNRIKHAAVKKDLKFTEAEKILGFSPEGLESYGYALRDYLRRHRMGGLDRKPPVGHHFTGWWKKHGAQHPEWFMMHEDGTRGPSKATGSENVPMCVSNPELHRFIAENWNGKDPIRLGEVDWPDACRCPACRAWDTPPPDPLPDFLVSQTDRGLPKSAQWQSHRGHVLHGFYRPMCTSDRYARFWQSVQQLAAKRNPDALVTTYLYYGYFPAPTSGIQLGPHVYGEFVPWGNPQHTDFFPMRAEALEWVRQQWLGWQRTGIRLAYRPNYLHDGWVMPLVDTRQSGDFFRFAVENGMEGTRFDSLTGQWSAQGPKLYVHMRLHAKPDLTVDAILDEYYGAFGPASKAARDYFGYWEQYCLDNFQKFNDLFIDHGHRWARFQLLAHKAFPAECFAPAERLLDKAEAAAAKDARPEFAQRVKFLRDGMEHARIGLRLAGCFDGDRNLPAGPEHMEKAVAVMRDLIAFRRAHEVPYISDYFYGGAYREERFWNLKPIFAKLQGEQTAGQPAAADTAQDTKKKLP
ncbi:MAG: DUF4838 domain-containing protein [Kiritimatiellae bacterium]|nr:DUF4838 domain-containing protein [Kiritimatiellia bacterium]